MQHGSLHNIDVHIIRYKVYNKIYYEIKQPKYRYSKI